MGIFERLSDLASAAGEKTSGAIEIGKLRLRLGSEEKKIAETTLKLGECLLRNLDAGQNYDETMMSLYEDIKISRGASLTIREEIAALSGLVLCASCQAENPRGSRFCQACGTGFPEETVVEATGEIVELHCPSCHAVVAPDAIFCNQCGTKLHEEEED